jgi:hypothetical protein
LPLLVVQCSVDNWRPQLGPFLILLLQSVRGVFFIFFFHYCAGGTLCYLQKFLKFIKYIILKFTPSHFPLASLSRIPGIVSFFHLHACVHSICTIFILLHPFSTSSCHPEIPPSQDRTCSTLLFSDSVKEKKWYFCLLKIAIQGVYLWCFHACMYYNLNWLISSIFLPSTLVPFLWWFQQV